MKLKSFLLNLSISFALVLGVVAYVDNRNPMMGFLSSKAGWTLIYIAAAVIIVTAIFVLHDYRHAVPPPQSKERERRSAPKRTQDPYDYY